MRPRRDFRSGWGMGHSGGAGRWPCRDRARRAWPDAPGHRGLSATGQSCRDRSAGPAWLRLLGTAARPRKGCACWPRRWCSRPAGGATAAEAYRLQGELLLRQAVPDAAQAEACFQQALAIARRQQAKSWELRAAMSLSRLWQQQGKRTEAHALLAPVYGWFTEGFDTADLQEAKALLEELARGEPPCPGRSAGPGLPGGPDEGPRSAASASTGRYVSC